MQPKMIHKQFSSGFVHCHQWSNEIMKGMQQNIILTLVQQRRCSFSRKYNKLKTHCNVISVMQSKLDFLSYCSTDEYPEKLGKLIRLINNAIQVQYQSLDFLTRRGQQQELTNHYSSFQFPTTKAMQYFLCQGSLSSQKLLKLYLQFPSSLLLHITKPGLSLSTKLRNAVHVCRHEVKCYAQQIIFLICFAHSIAFSQ